MTTTQVPPPQSAVPPTPRGSSAPAVLAIILGALSFLLAFIAAAAAGVLLLSGICGVAALVLGITAIRSGRVAGPVVAIVLGVIGLLVTALMAAYHIDTAGGRTTGSASEPPSVEELSRPYAAPSSTYGYSGPATTAPSEVPAVPAPLPQWGTTQTIGQGVTATASRPRSFTPSSYAAGLVPGSRYVRVDITIRNDSGKYLNFSDEVTHAQYLGGASTPAIYDYSDEAQPVGAPPNRAVPSGRSVTYSLAWAIPDGRPTLVGLDMKAVGQGYAVVGQWAGTA